MIKVLTILANIQDEATLREPDVYTDLPVMIATALKLIDKKLKAIHTEIELSGSNVDLIAAWDMCRELVSEDEIIHTKTPKKFWLNVNEAKITREYDSNMLNDYYHTLEDEKEMK